MLSFWDFVCRDFGTCEYKGIRPCVFWVPKCRNIVTYPHAIILGFHKSGFQDLQVQGNSHLGTPGAEIPKCRSLRRPFSLVQGFKTYAIKSSSRSLDKLSKRVSLWGDLSRALLETNKGINFPRTDLKTESI
jgi:hypothetical protein